ncbi:hypothetical protein ACH5AU_23880 [Streptomyces albidoflavus]
MTEPDEVLAVDAFYDCLEDPDFDASLLMDLEELFGVPPEGPDRWRLL